MNNIYAITGPSGSGKTTLCEKIITTKNILLPQHCTTRLPRNDDKPDFYKYLEHYKFREYADANKFLFFSGDGPTVERNYGNFYGVLEEDCKKKLTLCNNIIVYASYKDILNIVNLNKTKKYNVKIINLTFCDIENGVKTRLLSDVNRNHKPEDIDKRIAIAINDYNKYSEILKEYATTTVFTDELDAEKTYTKVCKDLNLNKSM